MGFLDGLFGFSEEIPQWYLDSQQGLAKQQHSTVQMLVKRLERLERLVAGKSITGTNKEEQG